MKRSAKTAYLIFADDPHIEAQKKIFSYAHSNPINHQVSTTLTAEICRLTRQLNYPVILVGSDKQTGASFGEKLANAFDYVFAKGYDKVIAVGNDCIGLSTGILRKAADKLSINDCVYGPSADGGCYLIGLTKKSFDKKEFETLPWQSPELYKSLLTHKLSNTTIYTCLPFLRDLDTEQDVYANNALNAVARAIFNLIQRFKQLTCADCCSEIFNCCLTLFLLRAPPLV